MQITIRGKRWKLRFCRLRNNHGECDSPATNSKQIRISHRIRDERLLDVLIHEGLHACHWDLDEEAVDRSAKDLARMLWRLGYRRNTDCSEDA